MVFPIELCPFPIKADVHRAALHLVIGVDGVRGRIELKVKHASAANAAFDGMQMNPMGEAPA